MKIGIMKTFWCLIVLHQGYAQDMAKSQASSYFFMKHNGGYEYAFNTDTGMQSAQTADQSNEVTGHYMYYEKGVPFMVKYRAGVNGYQPEIIPVEKLMDRGFSERNLKNYPTSDNSALTARDLRPPSLQETHTNNYRLSAPKVASFNSATDTTLNFVQNALKTMQSQPMHMSFNSESRQIQHPSSHYTTTIRPTASTILQPVTRNEVQEINNMPLLPTASLPHNKHTYTFNYNADQSARSDGLDTAASYSYFDESGYHDVAYKATDNTAAAGLAFMVLGGNLGHNQLSPLSTASHQTQRRQLFRSNNFNVNNFRIIPDTRLAANALNERNLGKRSLRKFRRYAKW